MAGCVIGELPRLLTSRAQHAPSRKWRSSVCSAQPSAALPT